eukprot:comp16904_c0_seq1/m.15441 comp16904_c0_seq1/g.15441  ORF comp16904_c0_seq1/g.15441 comp16904_c0_seq1/m.15441 type:complete len:114 (-) comp16904_c0_seq1:487-828(-)
MASTTWIDGTKWDFYNPDDEPDHWRGWGETYTYESINLTSESLKPRHNPDPNWQRDEWGQWGVSYEFQKINLTDARLKHRQTPLARWEVEQTPKPKLPGFTMTGGGYICEVGQ